MTEATLLGISVRPALHAPVATKMATQIFEASGLEGDHRRGRGARMVTILFKEQWDAACAEVGVELPWTTRRANLFVDGMVLRALPDKGSQVQIGTAVLEVTGETTPCHYMEAAQTGLQDALNTDCRGGVTCRVMQEGQIHVGDAIRVLETAQWTITDST